MRYIEKNQPSEEIQQILASKSQYEGQMYENETTLILNSLLLEQHDICCYCQERLTISKATIEHFLPQSVGREKSNSKKSFSTLDLNYSNYYAACHGSEESIEDIVKLSGRHCDKEKGSKIIPSYLFDIRNQTHLETLNPYFYYDSKGYLLPNGCKSIDEVSKIATQGTKQLVWATILILNLNHSKLIDRREKAFRQFGQLIETKTVQELKTIFKKLSKDDSFMPFIEMRLQQIAQRYLFLTQKETKK